MSLFRIALRSIQQRGLASMLTMVSMALGVTMVVAVLSVHGVVSESFANSSSLGYNLVVGAKGGRLELTLNTVYYLSRPVENISYEYFSEFLPREARDAAFEHSIRKHVHDAQWNDLAALNQANGLGIGLTGITTAIGQEALQSARLKQLDLGRDGKYAQFTGLAIPVCLGDYFGPFRVVGTTPEMFDELKYGRGGDKSYGFSEGRNFKRWSSENGYFEAVVGSRVAREMNVKLGGEFSPAHGDPEGEGHAQKFKVVGILEPTGTPNDRAAFINMEGFYLMEDHAKPLTEDQQGGRVPPEASQPEGAQTAPLPIEQREVTAILVRSANPFVALSLPNLINEGNVAQCVLPMRQITELFEFIVKPVQLLLLTLTALICIVSAISILVSIYNSMSDRRHEIAVMRALGASREAVMTVILLESILLSLGGGILGWVGGHTLNVLASPYIEARTGVSIGFLDLAPPIESLKERFENLELVQQRPIIDKLAEKVLSLEVVIIPSLLMLAMFVGLLPAFEAYRTDVAKSLGK